MLPLRTIICPVDFSKPSFEALKVAGELAMHFTASIYVVHVLELSLAVETTYPFVAATAELHRKELEEKATEVISQTIEQCLPSGVYSFAIIETGHPCDVILRLAGEKMADLIVISTHGRTGWRRLVFGSVAEEVLRGAKCPVLTIRAWEDGTNETSAAA